MDEYQTAALNPWRSIWLKPRATIRQIITTNPEQSVVALAAANGVVQTLLQAADRNAGDSVGLLAILAFALLLGPIVGVISLYLWSWLVRWTGRWLGGVATADEMRAAGAWGAAPTVMGGVGLAVAVAIAGRALFTEQMTSLGGQPGLALIAIVGMLVQVVACLWSIVTLLKCVAEVQGFSVWRALGNVLLAGVVLVVPVIVLAFVAVAVGGK